jgi:U4/U6.U5 tri-snRNP-associated protein 1
VQNIEMAEHERIRKKSELKVKKRDHTGYDEDEFVAGNEGTNESCWRKMTMNWKEELEP